ncbi:unnamed protein product [Urochloa humidicola]
MRSMPFQLKSGHHHHHLHGAAMEGKPPPTTTQHPGASRVSMFRRLLVRVSASEKFVADGKEREKDEKPLPPPPPAAGEADAAGSVGLDRMVLSFMEAAAGGDRGAAAEEPLQLLQRQQPRGERRRGVRLPPLRAHPQACHRRRRRRSGSSPCHHSVSVVAYGVKPPHISIHHPEPEVYM